MTATLVFDISAVLLCSSLLLSRSWMSLLHPAPWYLIFHVFVVSQRFWTVSNGNVPTFLWVPLSDIATAVAAADVLLIALTLAWLYEGSKKRHVPPLPEGTRDEGSAWHFITVCVVTIPTGLFALISVGYVPGLSESSVTRGSYLELAIVWPAVSGVALLHRFGLKWKLLLPTVAYVIVMGLQGFGRFRLILPLALLLLVILNRKGRRWPTFGMTTTVLLVAVAFPVLKTIGTDLQQGAVTRDAVVRSVQQSADEIASGTSREQAILDQGAIVIARTDNVGALGLGEPYLKAFIFMIPRSVWPEKPHMGEHIVNLSSPAYPLGAIGATSTLFGDLYYNFRWWGLVGGGLAIGLLTGRAARWAAAKAVRGPSRLLYFAFLVTLIQVFRDGPLALVLFMALSMTPVVAIFSAARLFPPKTDVSSQGQKRLARR